MSKSKKLLAAVLSCIMIFTIFAVPVSVSAAAKPKLNKTKATITRTKSIKLTLKNATASKVKWSSSKKSIATVSKGKVKGKKAGKATITAKYNGKSYKCKVTVKGRVIDKKKTFSVAKNCTIKIKFSGITVKKWKSSRTSVATVSSKGVVKGKKVGTVTITAIDKYGDFYKCKVKVVDPAITLKNYITKNGSIDDDGNYYIYDEYTYTFSSGGSTDYDCYITYNSSTKKFEFYTHNLYDVYYCVEMEVPYAGGSKYPTIYYGYDDSSGVTFDSTTTVNPATYNVNTDLYFELVSGSINYSDLQDYGNTDFYVSMCIWDDMLKDAGLSMAAFGFVKF